MKNVTLGWKLEKAVYSENKKIFEDLWAKQIEERKGNDRTAPEAFIRSSTPSKIETFKSSIQEFLPQILESIKVGFDACQIVIFRN